MFKGVKILLASIFALLLCATPASAINLSSLEQISAPSENIEINTPETGYDFDVNFLAKDQELKYKATIENDEEYPIKIESINLNNSSYNFLEYSYSGISVDDVINVGEIKEVIISVETNSNNTSTIAENYNLTLNYTQIKPTPDPEDPDRPINPETATTAVVKTGTIALISIGAIVFVFVRNKKIRNYIVLFVATSLGVIALTTAATAEEAASTFSILGKVRFTNIYSVTVDPNEGTYSGELTATRREGEAFHIEEVSREHFEFVEWEINPLNTPDENNNIAIHTNTTLKAKWNENTYTLTIKPNGGKYADSEETWTQSYRPLETVTIATPEKEGYRFTHWTVELGNVGQDGSFSGNSVNMTEDITLVANYEIKKFSVRINPNGGTYNGETTPYINNEVEWGTEISLADTSREWYRLVDWTWNESKTKPASTQTITIYENTTLVANWEQIHYTLTINPNGGTYDGSADIQAESYPVNTEVSLLTPERDTYRFTGWTIEPTAVLSDGKITITQDYTLTANWEEIYYTLTINPNTGSYDGSTEAKVQSIRAGQSASINNPQKEGYDFVDWSVEEGTIGQGGHFSGDSVVMTEDVTLVANYTIKQFTVTIIPNGGTYDGALTTTVDWNTNYEIEEISRDRYGLESWTKTVGADSTTIAANTESVNIKEDTTLEANWFRNVFTLTIKPNGGSYNGSEQNQSQDYSINAEVSILTPEKEGYDFTHWTVEQGSIGQDGNFSGNSVTMTEDITLVANYEIKQFTVTIIPNNGTYAGELTATVDWNTNYQIKSISREGYGLESWTKTIGETSSTLNANTESVNIRDNTTLEANWFRNVFALTINPNGGSYNGSEEIQSQNYTINTEVSILTPERATYRFTGWTIEPNTELSNSKITMDKDYTLTANWEEIYYNLTIDPNGGIYTDNEGIEHTESFTEQKRAGLEICPTSPIRDTYNFTGWLSDQIELNNEGCFTLSEDTTITADWDEIYYNLTINPNGGKYNEQTGTFTQQRRAKTEVCLSTPVRATYSFTGWDSQQVTLDNTNCFTITQDTEFSANWEEIYYNLTIDPNGGIYTDEEGIAHTDSYTTSRRAGTTVSLNEPTRVGFDFAKWTLNNDSLYDGNSITINETTTLVANWDDIYFDVTINPNGGIYTNNGVEYTKDNIWTGRIKYGDSVDLTSTTWTDNEITHWTQNETEIPANTSTVEIYEDTDFVAYWQSTIFHTITIIPNGGVYNESTEPSEYSVRQGTTFTFQRATRDDGIYSFEAWYEGDEVDESKKFNETEFIVEEDKTFIANWFRIVARIIRNDEFYKNYPSIMAAHEEAISNDTIELLVDTEEIVNNSKNITIDLGSHTVTGYLTNATNSSLTLINGEIDNYTNPITNTANPNGAAVINNGTLTMGKDDYEEDDDHHKAPLINNQYIRIIGSEVGLQQNNIFYFYDGYIEGDLGLVGGYDGSPWYRETFDGIAIYYFPFVTHNTAKDCQHVELTNADKAVSKTSVHGDIYYYNLQDNIDTSSMTGYRIYAVRDFDASHTLTVANEGEDIVFDITGYEVNLGDTVTINGKLKITDSKSNEEAGLLTSSKTIINNGTLDVENTTISALTANTLLRNSGNLTMENAILSSDKGTVVNTIGDNSTINADNNSYIRATKSDANAILNDSPNLTLVSGNIEGYNCSIRNNSSKTFTMTGGYVKGTVRAICNYSGTINIQDGTVETSSSGSNYTIFQENGTINVSGGTIKSINSATNDWTDNAAFEYQNYGSSYVNITGGTIDVTSSSKGTTYATTGSSGKFTLDGADAKIIVKNTGDGAVNAIRRSSSEINIKQGTITAEAKNDVAILDRDSNTINISGGNMTAHSTTGKAYGFIGLGNGGNTLTMTGGNLDVRTDNSDKLGVALMNNTTIITGGNVYGSTYAIEGYNSSYTSNIRIGTNDSVIYNGQDGTEAKPIIQGGKYAINNGAISFYDGILKGGIKYVNNVNNIRAISDGSNQVVTDYDDPEEQDCWLEVEDTYLIIENDPERATNSLSQAFSMAEDGETIYYTRDITTAAVISGNSKNVTLDMQGHTIKYSQPITNSGTLTITDGVGGGSITNTNSSSRVITNNGALILDSGSLSGNTCTIQNNSGKTFTMNGGEVFGVTSTICSTGGIVNIEDGIVKSTSTYGNQAFEIAQNTTLNINGGLIEVINNSTSNDWVYTSAIHNSDNYQNNVNISGGEIKVTSSASGYADVVRGNYEKVIIDGADTKITATSTNSAYARLTGVYGGSVSIKNGTLTINANSATAFLDESSSASINISGGTMSIHSNTGNAYGTYGLDNYNGSSVTMTGGEIRSSTDASNKTGIVFMNSTVKMTGGYIYGSSYGIEGVNGNYTSTITLGTNDDTIYNGQNGIEAKPIIQGGKYAIDRGYVNFYDGILKGGDKYVNAESIIKAVPDGTSRVIMDYEDPIEQDCWLEADLPYIHVESNGEDYNSLTKALTYAASTDTFTITRSASTEAVLPAIEKNITIELDGNTLNYSQPLINSATLTITDRQGTGSITNNNSSVSTIRNNGTLTLDSGTIYNYSCAIENNSGKTFTMTGGKVTSRASAICNTSGTINIEDGIVESINDGEATTIRTNGGTINVTGGLIEAKTTVSTNYYSNYTAAFYDTSTTRNTINITNAEIKASTNRSSAYALYGSYGTVTIDGVNTKIAVSATDNSYATVFSKNYSTINIKNGTISAEATNNEAQIANSDYSDYILSGGTFTAHSTSSNAYGFKCIQQYSPNTVTMNGGSITATADSPDKLGIAIMANTVKLTSGEIYGSSYGIEGYENNTTSTITIGANDGTIYNGQNGLELKPVVIGGKYGIHNGNVYFYDGILKGSIDGYWNRNIKAIADQSYMYQGTETIDDVNYVTKYLAEETDLAKIGDGDCEDVDTTCYPSIQAAINASEEDDVIKLTRDNYVFNSIKVPANKKFTLDTYGFNIITGSYIENNGNMTIVNSQKATSNPLIRYDESNRFFLNKSGGTLQIEDIKIQSAQYTISSESGSTTIVKNAELKTTTGTYNYHTAISSYGQLDVINSKIAGGIYQNGAQFSITDSEITNYNVAVSANSTTGTITGSTITNTHSENEYPSRAYEGNNQSNVTITDSNLTGVVQVYGTTQTARLTINDSTIHMASTYQHPLIDNLESNGVIVLNNTDAELTTKGSQTGWNYSPVIHNKGTLRVENDSNIELKYDISNIYSAANGEGRIIDNLGTITIENSHLKNISINTAGKQNGNSVDNGKTYGLYNAGGTINFINSDITLTRNQSYGLYNESGTTRIKSGSIKANGNTSRGLWVKNGSITMGEAEPTDSANYGKETADVSTTSPYIEATTPSSTGIGVIMETGSFNFYDGKILQDVELGPALQSNGVDKATVTEVEYLYQPEKHQDENGHYYYILEFMR